MASRVRGDDRERWACIGEIIEENGEYAVKAEVPEVQKEDLVVRIEDESLQIAGERKWGEEEIGKAFHRMNRSWEFCALLFAPGGDGPTPKHIQFSGWGSLWPSCEEFDGDGKDDWIDGSVSPVSLVEAFVSRFWNIGVRRSEWVMFWAVAANSSKKLILDVTSGRSGWEFSWAIFLRSAAHE